MKKLLLTLAMIVTGGAVIAGPAMLARPAWAADPPPAEQDPSNDESTQENSTSSDPSDQCKESGGVPTAILGENGCAKFDTNGDGILYILNVVIDVLSVGIGILGVLGITIAGIQYLTAGGNEEQTRKAKRRILEIVIGLALYAVAYALLNWLLPGFQGTPTGNDTSMELPHSPSDLFSIARLLITKGL